MVSIEFLKISNLSMVWSSEESAVIKVGATSSGPTSRFMVLEELKQSGLAVIRTQCLQFWGQGTFCLSSGCRSKLPWAGWLKTVMYFSQFWRLEV